MQKMDLTSWLIANGWNNHHKPQTEKSLRNFKEKDKDNIFLDKLFSKTLMLIK